MTILQEPTYTDPQPKRWSREQYRAMAEAGIFRPAERPELVSGEVVDRRTGERRRWTVDEYYRLAEAGILGPEDRVQLVNGEILAMSPQNAPHGGVTVLVAETLRAVFGPGFVIRPQLPLALRQFSQPEPDIAVVPGFPRDYLEEHPTTAVLVVEVSDSTLRFDQRRKALLYAAAGVPEYWLVNLVDRCLEVRREPGAEGYADLKVYGPEATVSPLAAPEQPVAVADLLPGRRERANG